MGTEEMNIVVGVPAYEKVIEDDFYEREEDFSRELIRTTVKQYHSPAQNTRFYRRGNL